MFKKLFQFSLVEQGSGAAQAASTTPRARTDLRNIDTRFLPWRLR